MGLVYEKTNEEKQSSFCWSQNAVLVQSTKVEAMRWTGSGDGIIAGGIDVVLWKRNGRSWEIAWKFKADMPQSMVSATWSVEGPFATAAYQTEGLLTNKASKCVLVCQRVGKSGFLTSELHHPHPISMIQWRPLTGSLNRDAKHPPRQVLLTCSADGTARLWCEVDDGRGRKVGKDINDHKTMRCSFSVAAVIEINQALNGILGTDIYLMWATEIGGVHKTSEGAKQIFFGKGYEQDQPGNCEWLIGSGPGMLVNFWAIHCLDDVSPIRFPRVTLWKTQKLQGLKGGLSNYKDGIPLNKALSWEITLHSFDLSRSYCECQFDAGSAPEGSMWRFETTFANERYCLNVKPCSSKIPDPHTHDDVSSFAVVCPGRLIRIEKSLASTIDRCCPPYILATGCSDGSLKLWRSNMDKPSTPQIPWELVGMLVAHQGPISSICLSDCGRKIATISKELPSNTISNLRIWDPVLLADAGTFMLEDTLSFGQDLVALNWLYCGNGQLLLGACTQNLLQWLFPINKKHLANADPNCPDYLGRMEEDIDSTVFIDCGLDQFKKILLGDSRRDCKSGIPLEIDLKKDYLSSSLFLARAQLTCGSATKLGLWNMHEVIEKLNGSLPVYHPEALFMNIYSVYSNDRGFQWSGDASLVTSSSQFQRNLDQFTYSLDSYASSNQLNSSSTKTELSDFVEPFEKLYKSAAISDMEKIQILSIIDLLIEMTNSHSGSAYESLDEPGRRFWVALRFQQLHSFRKHGRLASVEELVVDSKLIGWAYHSDCQENLFGSFLPNDPSWQEMRNLGIGFWFTNTAQLRSRMEKLARLQYLKRKDPKDCALLYTALNRIQVLSGLFRISKDEKDKPLVGFLSRNFQEEKNKAAALKNAYVLMGRHQLELAIAFFLLGGDTSSAVNICAKNLGDEQLALVICRLVEGRGGPLERHLITKFMLPFAIEKDDYWLASLLELEALEYLSSLPTIRGDTDERGMSDLGHSENLHAILNPSPINSFNWLSSYVAFDLEFQGKLDLTLQYLSKLVREHPSWVDIAFGSSEASTCVKGYENHEYVKVLESFQQKLYTAVHLLEQKFSVVPFHLISLILILLQDHGLWFVGFDILHGYTSQHQELDKTQTVDRFLSYALMHKPLLKATRETSLLFSRSLRAALRFAFFSSTEDLTMKPLAVIDLIEYYVQLAYAWHRKNSKVLLLLVQPLMITFTNGHTPYEVDMMTLKKLLPQIQEVVAQNVSSDNVGLQLASLLQHKMDYGLHVRTLVWLEESNQSQTRALNQHLNQDIVKLDTIDERHESDMLWVTCADPKMISESFAEEKINWSHSLDRKPSKEWSNICRGITTVDETEEIPNHEVSLNSSSASTEAGSPAKSIFRGGHSFLGAWQKDTTLTKEVTHFLNPKEIYKRNGELLEALCLNSIDQGQAALASNRKGILFFNWKDDVSFGDHSDYIWSEADWPLNGWAGSESTPAPTCVSPGVGLGSKKGAHLGLGGATVGVGSLTRPGRDLTGGGAFGIPGYAGIGASGLGWETQEDFEELVDPPATVENANTRAFSSHPSRPFFLVGSSNTHIYLWEFGKDKTTATYGVLPAANVPPPYALASISALQFDHCGHRFATAALDGTVCTWQLEVGGRSNIGPTESSLCFNSHASDVAYVTSSGSIIAVAGFSSNNVNVVIWDTLAPPTTSRASILCHEGGARSLSVFDNDIGSGSISPLIVTGGKGGDVGLHDFRYIATGRSKRHRHSDKGEQVMKTSSNIDVHPGNGTKLGEQNQNGMLWYIPKAHSGSVTKISIIPNTSLFLTGSKDGDVKLWDAKRAKLVYHWPKLHERHTFLQPSTRGFGGVVQG
ncbi:transducin family protein / WD-40 repeat family protein [Prunus dulcis]|uniref:Transducin family protein / WD-40 repeat family protein n=1 Tax=Prunus dulcis TaxID=3755 RepID=A0A4Y1R0P8_PRUDU|nr:transducin family protein / WD-40 repeat family protein [Prunus dulcis]